MSPLGSWNLAYRKLVTAFEESGLSSSSSKTFANQVLNVAFKAVRDAQEFVELPAEEYHLHFEFAVQLATILFASRDLSAADARRLGERAAEAIGAARAAGAATATGAAEEAPPTGAAEEAPTTGAAEERPASWSRYWPRHRRRIDADTAVGRKTGGTTAF